MTPEASAHVIGVADADAGYIGRRSFIVSLQEGGDDRRAAFWSTCSCGGGPAVEGHSHHSRQIGLAIRLGEQQHAEVETAMMDDGVLGESPTYTGS